MHSSLHILVLKNVLSSVGYMNLCVSSDIFMNKNPDSKWKKKKVLWYQGDLLKGLPLFCICKSISTVSLISSCFHWKQVVLLISLFSGYILIQFMINMFVFFLFVIAATLYFLYFISFFLSSMYERSLGGRE